MRRTLLSAALACGLIGAPASLVCTAYAPAQAQQPAPATVTLRVDGMHCATCPITVRVALERLDGVTSANVNLERARAVVIYDPRRVTPERLVRAVEEAGYRASVESR